MKFSDTAPPGAFLQVSSAHLETLEDLFRGLVFGRSAFVATVVGGVPAFRHAFRVAGRGSADEEGKAEENAELEKEKIFKNSSVGLLVYISGTDLGFWSGVADSRAA